MTISTEQFHRYEDSIQKTRTKQRKEITEQLQGILDGFFERKERIEYLCNRIDEIEREIDDRNGRIEALYSVFNRAQFEKDENTMENARATRVNEAAAIARLEDELVGLKHELEDSDFDLVSEADEAREAVKTVKGLMGMDVHSGKLTPEIERAYWTIDSLRSDAVRERVRANRAS